jgi:hypothetical protein
LTWASNADDGQLAGIDVAGGESIGKPEKAMAIADGNPKC